MAYYIYGHYDSRGGGFLVEAESREEADKKYVEQYGLEDYPEMSAEEQAKQLIEEDFLFGEVTLETYREVADGEDIEEGAQEDNEHSDEARAFEDGLQWATEEVQEITPNPWLEMLWWNEDTKTLRLLPAGQNPEPGWKRSNFGEDACGLVLIRK